jgi:hypothetical protein
MNKDGKQKTTTNPMMLMLMRIHVSILSNMSCMYETKKEQHEN